MHLCRIILTPKNKIIENIDQVIFDYLEVLYQNGQVMINYEFIENENVYFIYCKLPEKDSLNKENNNIYVDRYYEKVEELFYDKVEYLGGDTGKGYICSCKLPSWYILYSSYSEGGTPILCGKCMKTVPLYRLPKILEQNEYHKELYWQRNYHSIHQLYISCLSDRFTYRQMNNVESSLSKEGRIICEAFEKAVGKPFYYYLVNYKGNLNKCPKCNNEWEQSDNIEIVDLKCEKCRLVTDYGD